MNPFQVASSKELLGIVQNVLETLSEKESAILRLRFGLFDDNLDRSEYEMTDEEAASFVGV